MKILDCPNCNKSTCRECNEEAHIPLRCDEVEKKTHTNARLKIEEAMSQARIRECPNPKCKTRFYKTEGCNKMTCSCGHRSEEHTSELQSLMRISYAVFCLKKKKHQHITIKHKSTHNI